MGAAARLLCGLAWVCATAEDQYRLVLLEVDSAPLPLRLATADLELAARRAVDRHGLEGRAVGPCVEGEAGCVAALLASEARTAADAEPCRLEATGTLTNGREKLGVELRVARGNATAAFEGKVFIDVYVEDGTTMAAWADLGASDHGYLTLFLKAWQSGVVRADFSGVGDCDGPMWFHAGFELVLGGDVGAAAEAELNDATVVGAHAADLEGAIVVVQTTGLNGTLGTTPARLRLPTTRGDLLRQALAAVDRFRLADGRTPSCGAGDRWCVARVVAEQALAPAVLPPCRLSIERPREGEVMVLGHIDLEIAVEVVVNGTWARVGRFAGNIFVDAWPSDPRDGLATMRARHGWTTLTPEFRGSASVKLTPPRRRPGGGGSVVPRVSGVVDVNIAAYGKVEGCGAPTWMHGGRRVVYRPFAEPDPPAPVLSATDLRRDADDGAAAGLSRAYATILYDTARDSGYAHGLLALRRSLVEAGATDPLYALVGDGVDGATQATLAAVGVLLRAATRPKPAAAQESSALPALGVGQWAKLELWKLPVDRVLYLDADAMVVRNVDEVFAALPDAKLHPVAAVDDYFSGGVIFLAPDPDAEAAFAATLAMDDGRYVYGEQDFLNVHFAGAHARLPREYKCFATDKNHRDLDCAIVEFSSCPTQSGMAWKPWHGTAVFAPGFVVCYDEADDDLVHYADLWRGFHERALAEVAGLGLPPLPDPAPYQETHRVADAAAAAAPTNPTEII